MTFFSIFWATFAPIMLIFLCLPMDLVCRHFCRRARRPALMSDARAF